MNVFTKEGDVHVSEALQTSQEQLPCGGWRWLPLLG